MLDATDKPTLLEPYSAAVQGLIACGQDFYRRGWSLGTSSNYSVVVGRDPLRLVMTGSGFDKGHLTPEQFVLVNEDAHSLHPSFPKPSAEALLHTALAKAAGAGAVLHTHSVSATVLSEGFLSKGHLPIAGYEMLKGLTGITTHETAIEVPIFQNTQDIASLAKVVGGAGPGTRQIRCATVFSCRATAFTHGEPTSRRRAGRWRSLSFFSKSWRKSACFLAGSEWH